MSTLLSWAIGILSPVIIGGLTKLAYDLLEKGLPWLDTHLPSFLKPIWVTVVAALLSVAAKALNVPGLSGDPTTWTPDTVHTLIAAIFAVILHIATKSGSTPSSTPPAPIA